MSVKKELTVEELLELASKDVSVEDIPDTTKDLSEVQKFVNHFKIKEGKDRIDMDVMYQIYFDWREAIPNVKNGTKIVNRYKFKQDFSKFFKKMTLNDKGISYKYFLLDRTQFNIFSDKEMHELFWKSRRKINKDKAKLEKDQRKKTEAKKQKI